MSRRDDYASITQCICVGVATGELGEIGVGKGDLKEDKVGVDRGDCGIVGEDVSVKIPAPGGRLGQV